MIAWLKTKSRTFVGIDIGEESVKLLELHKTRKKYCVVNYAIASGKDIFAALKSVRSQAKSKFRTAAIAVPYSAAIIKNIFLDARLQEIEIEKYLQTNIHNHIGYQVNDIMMDFKILGAVKHDPNKIEIQLIAAKKAAVNSKIKLLKKLGITAHSVDITVFALQRAVSLLSNNEKIMPITYLSTNKSLFCVFAKEKIIYMKEEIIDDNTADGIAQKINCELQLFLTKHNYPIKQILLVSEKVLQAAELNSISEKIGISFLLANPFVNMDIADNIEKNHFFRIAHTMMISCGLAMGWCNNG